MVQECEAEKVIKKYEVRNQKYEIRKKRLKDAKAQIRQAFFFYSTFTILITLVGKCR